ncbi:chondroadherin [Thalassophryne amazonica]|uniref:chondroadherin n=1 Tax=Thalassophryne amazonica TaxID=390379 RepID=UPI00147178CF|nr:chondroadherin [Thalassophryne amazonica]
MFCMRKLLLGACFLLMGQAVQGVPSQCPNLCHCHGDLQHVICDSVGLKKIPRVSEATRLLNLQRNNLGTIPTGSFSESKGLISLHMQHCQLREIGSQAFKGLKKLVYLYLSNNEISSIKPGAFEDLTELTYLYLDGNQISELAKGIFSPMINLFILQLNDNRLRELRPGTFTGAKDLRWLHMSGNELTTLHPGSLDEVENLAIFHLDRNKMTTYPSAAMSKLRVVEELTLGRNPMRTIPENAFQSFGRYMEKLHLDNMGLEKFSDGAFTGVTAVKVLSLDNNKLKTLPKSLAFGTITNLTLSNNPWSCTCQLAPCGGGWMQVTVVQMQCVLLHHSRKANKSGTAPPSADAESSKSEPEKAKEKELPYEAGDAGEKPVQVTGYTCRESYAQIILLQNRPSVHLPKVVTYRYTLLLFLALQQDQGLFSFIKIKAESYSEQQTKGCVNEVLDQRTFAFF